MFYSWLLYGGLCRNSTGETKKSERKSQKMKTHGLTLVDLFVILQSPNKFIVSTIICPSFCTMQWCKRFLDSCARTSFSACLKQALNSVAHPFSIRVVFPCRHNSKNKIAPTFGLFAQFNTNSAIKIIHNLFQYCIILYFLTLIPNPLNSVDLRTNVPKQ